MAATNRRRFDGLLAAGVPLVLGAALVDGSGTTITFPDELLFAGGQSVPDIADPDYVPLVIGPDTDNLEVVWLTAYTEGASTGTIVRGREGTTGVAHLIDTPVVHGPTVTDVGILVGEPVSYTFQVADEADPDSWYGDAGVKVYLANWTPTRSGDLVWVAPLDNGDSDWDDDNFDIYLFPGGTVDVDYPGPTAGSEFWDGPSYIDVTPTSRSVGWRVLEGFTYAVVLVDWAGGAAAVGHSIDLSGVLNSLYPFGGITDPPPPYAGPEPSTVAVLPDGTMVRRFVPLGSAGTGQDATAMTRDAQAIGQRSHAEGTAIASGQIAHAEGGGSEAAGFVAHAEGAATEATGYAAHAQGVRTLAWRTGEHASGSGYVIAGFSTFQESRLTLGAEVAASTTAQLAVGLNEHVMTPDLPLTPSKISVIRGLVAARAGAVRAAWKYEVVAMMGTAGATPTLIAAAAVASIAADAGAAAWTFAITATTDGLLFTGVGSTVAGTIWAATAEILEV